MYGRDAERQLGLLLVIITQQAVEFHEYIRVFQLSGNELSVVETLAEVQHQFYISHDNGVLEFVGPFLKFVPDLPHQQDEYIVFFVGHVQGFIDTVIEKGVILYGLFQMGRVQQVGMKKQRPSRQHHLFAVILLPSYLAGSHADDGSFLVVVFAASVCQIYFRFIVKEDSVHAVIVQAVTDGGHFRVIDDTDQRMAVGVPDIAAVIAYISYLHNLSHSICKIGIHGQKYTISIK